jgi:hypothetical protein
LAWFGPNGYISQNESVVANTRTIGWQQLTISGDAPVGATIVQVHLKSANNPGTSYFDDVSVVGTK